MEGEGVQLTIDTQTDSYEQAIAAVQAAYGLNPAAVTSSWPDAPSHEPRPGPETLADEDLGQGWTERMLFDTVAAVMPRARAVLRRLVEVGGTVSGGDAAEGLESVEAAFDDVAVAVDLPVERWRSPAAAAAVVPVSLLVGLLWDGVADAAFAQVDAEAAGAVGLVCDDLVGPAAWSARPGARDTDALQKGSRADAVVALAGWHQDRERVAPAVAGEMDFGGQSASGSAEGVIVPCRGGSRRV